MCSMYHGVQDFADMTAPALAPIFQAAKGDTLLLLIRSAPTLLKCMPRKYVTSMLVPLLAQAADQGGHSQHVSSLGIDD